MWDWASRNPIAVLAGAIGVVQLFREAVPRRRAGRLRSSPSGSSSAHATLLASIAQPAFEARYVLVGLPALALAIGAGVVSLPRRWALALAIALAITMTARLVQHYVDPGDPLIR